MATVIIVKSRNFMDSSLIGGSQRRRATLDEIAREVYEENLRRIDSKLAMMRTAVVLTRPWASSCPAATASPRLPASYRSEERKAGARSG